MFGALLHVKVGTNLARTIFGSAIPTWKSSTYLLSTFY